MKQLFLIVLILLSCSMAHAQDPTWSMPQGQAQDLNPALTGSFNGRHRFSASHRSQWISVLEGQAYHTQAFQYALRFCGHQDGYFGLGARVLVDEIGTAPYRTRQGQISGSYMHLLGGNNNHSGAYLAVGAEIGLMQHSLDTNNLSFNAQFIDGGYLESAASGENFLRDQYHFQDFSVGGVLHLGPFELGVSAAHILWKTQRSFIASNGLDENRLPVTYAGHFIAELMQNNDDLFVNLENYYFQQGRFWMFQTGIQMSYYLDSENEYGPIGGLHTRWVGQSEKNSRIESVILSGGYDFGDFTIFASYDINTSSLITASRGKGAFEISMEYLIPMGDNDCVWCPRSRRRKIGRSFYGR